MAYINGKKVLSIVRGSGGGDGSSIIIDDAMSAISTNPVQNKVVTQYVVEQIARIDAIETQLENGGTGETGGVSVTVGGEEVSSLSFKSDPQTQIDRMKNGTDPVYTAQNAIFATANANGRNIPDIIVKSEDVYATDSNGNGGLTYVGDETLNGVTYQKYTVTAFASGILGTANVDIYRYRYVFVIEAGSNNHIEYEAVRIKRGSSDLLKDATFYFVGTPKEDIVWNTSSASATRYWFTAYERQNVSIGGVKFYTPPTPTVEIIG